MKTILLSIIFLTGLSSIAQTNYKEQFIKDLLSSNIEDGCKITVYIVDLALNASCFIPEPTISKVACAAAQIVNASTINSFDPNTPNVIMDAGVRVCQITYSLTGNGIKFTIDYAENQMNEIRSTYNWLNSLEGVVFFLNYVKN